jgi:TonB family protein
MKTLLLHTFLFIQVLGYASGVEEGFVLRTDTVIPNPHNEMPVTFPIDMPKYPGGEEQLLKDVQANIAYPKLKKNERIERVVMVEICIDVDGYMKNAIVVRGIKSDPRFDEAALKAVKKLKRFSPAIYNGEPRQMTFVIPVRFKLNEESKSDTITHIDTTIYDFAEVMPEFPGGEMAMIKFVQENFKLSNANIDQPIQTKTFVEYVVEPDGTISNVKEYRGNKEDVLTKELIRVVKMFPKHTPAKQNDKSVRVRLIAPLNIDLKQ